MREKSVVKNLEDVCEYLGASRPTNESLAHRVYKDTACGAWAKVSERPKWQKRKEVWTVHYARSESLDLWDVQGAFRNGVLVDLSTIPLNVKQYFLMGKDNESMRSGDSFDEISKGAKTFSITEEIDAEYDAGSEIVFSAGSIVEGCDAEVGPLTLVLPCAGEELNRLLQTVEDEVEEIWNSTHGCEECVADEDWQPGITPVNPDCKKCGGSGAAI